MACVLGFAGVWIGGQISDCNGKIGYTQGNFGVQISKLTFELFESRYNSHVFQNYWSFKLSVSQFICSSGKIESF